MPHNIRTGLLILIIALIGFFVWQRFQNNDFNLPKHGETKTAESLVTTDKTVTKEVLITDGVKHTIPIDEILQGCPGKDCIPSINNPTFTSIEEASSWLPDDAPGIAFSKNGIDRFYPFNILVWHEIVNDTFDDERVLISYCPLCLTAVVYDPLVEGERVEFGISGLLWESNLIMYDRKTSTLWSQVLGEAVVGELAGTELKILSSDQVRYRDWKKTFPNGEVLSRDTGHMRDYSRSPYGNLFEVTSIALSFAEPSDTRLPFNALVFGIVENKKPKAYHVEAVKQKGTVTDSFEGKNIELEYNKELDVVRMFEILPNNERKRINPLSGFWFSWAEAHPETELYK